MRAVLLAAAALAGVAAAGAASADPGPGVRAYQKCYSCHATEAGKNDLEGPSLNGIIGRKIAAVPGYDYSPAIRRFATKNPRWTAELLDRFIVDPDAVVKGTRMNFPGMLDAKERKALVEYLRSLGR